jgi:predicted site-specific integrase-resolvase
VSPRRYAELEGISLQTAYQHIWQGKVAAEQVLGRWLILPESESEATEKKPA